MDWLNNANTIASLIAALIGIGGFVYGVGSYLKKKALPIQQTNSSSRLGRETAHQPSVPYQAFTLLEWAEFFGQGVVDTSEFILNLCFQKADPELDEWLPIGKLGGCLGLCLVGGVIALLILGGIISLLFAGLGIPNDKGNAAGAISLMLILAILSLVYVYHVGRRAEQKRQQQYQTTQRQQNMRQTIQR